VKFFSILIALAYTALFLSLNSSPFTDAPNHLARAAIMNSLWSDPHSPFHASFSASHFFMPYMLPDLGVILLIRTVGFQIAGPVWSTLTMLALVLSIWFYARQILTTPSAITAALLCSWYIATNYLFILGFFSFQWGIAAAFIALGALEAWRRDKGIILYMTACLFCYGSHLAPFAILAVIVTSIGLIRTILKQQAWTRFALELSPFALLTAYHLLLVPAHPEAPTGDLNHNTVADKFGHFVEALFVRQNYVIDRSILVLFWAIIVIALWFGTGRRKHWELATICAIAAAIYFVLPFGIGAIVYLDERALPFFFIPLLILSLRIFESTSRPALLLTACALLAAANLGSLALFLPRQNHEAAQFREALLAIPSNKIVLPIQTHGRDGNTYPLRHVASFYAAEHAGYVPYLFSQISGGGPSGYFRDLSTIYRPPPNWYIDNTSADWEKIAQAYDYVAITKPWLRERIDLSRLDLYYENAAATVFRVKPPRRELLYPQSATSQSAPDN
jgi:hypothetical protein